MNNAKHALRQINIAPTQREQLPSPHAGRHRQRNDGKDPRFLERDQYRLMIEVFTQCELSRLGQHTSTHIFKSLVSSVPALFLLPLTVA